MAVANPDPISEEKTDIPETDLKIDNTMLALPTSFHDAKKLFSTARNHVGLRMIYKSYRAHRFHNTASIFLFGMSGAGKSSTLNHLFGGDLIPTSTKKSCTRDVIEYGCTMDSTHWKVEGLGLGFVDTPGYGDTNGSMQDARNLTTIAGYVHTKYSKWTRNIYPNIVLVVVNGSDNRMFGIESKVSQMLHVLSKLNIVDRERPNVVVAVTHAMNLRKKRFIEKSQGIAKDCAILSKLHLMIEAPVVFIENDDEDELEIDGDWKILPDGTRQPLNLYQAMMNLMKKSGDEVGVEAIRIFFSNTKELKVELNHTTPQVKSDDKLIGNWMELIKANFNASQSEIYTILLEDSKSLGFTIDEPELMVLAHNLKVAKLLKRSDIEGKKVEKVKQILRPYVLNNSEIQILCKIFKLEPLDHLKVDLLGLGIFYQKKERILDVSSEEFSFDKGIFVPQHFHIKQCGAVYIDIVYKNERGLRFLSKDWRLTAQYIRIEYTIQFLLFKVEAVDTAKLSLNAKFCKFLTEKLSRKCSILETFTEIPLDAFHEKFGTHCITGLRFGGILKGFTCKPSALQYSRNRERLIEHVREIRWHLDSYFDYLMMSKNQPNPPKYEYTILDDLNENNLTWQGGDMNFHPKTLGGLTPEVWNAWIDSLNENPILLDDYVETSLFKLLNNSPDIAAIKHAKYFKPHGAIKPDLDDLYNYTAPDSMTENQQSELKFTGVHTRVMASEASKSETLSCTIL